MYLRIALIWPSPPWTAKVLESEDACMSSDTCATLFTALFFRDIYRHNVGGAVTAQVTVFCYGITGAGKTYTMQRA